MKNIDIRNLISQKRLKHYEVAEALNIDDCTLSRWLSRELTEDKKQKIIAIIDELSGSNYDGYEERVVDVKGRILSETPTIVPPQMGKKLVLTIDSRIQTLAEKALGDRVGSIIVLKPDTGEVLAMVSYPFYDSNIIYF